MICFINEISTDDFNMLRRSVGWKGINKKRAKIGLENSTYIVVAENDNEPIGMARVISDGGYVSLITDVIVKPEYQRQGIGTKLMEYVMEYINNDLGDGENQLICLLSIKGKEPFYRKFGFIYRPNDINGAGMSQWISKN